MPSSGHYHYKNPLKYTKLAHYLPMVEMDASHCMISSHTACSTPRLTKQTAENNLVLYHEVEMC